MLKHALPVLLLAGLAACAQTHQPIVDLGGRDTARYQQDLFECRQYAEQVSPVGDAAVGAVGGAAAGAALGATTGLVLGGVGTGEAALFGAAAGGLLGLGGGALHGAAEQQTIIDNCLQGRGYRILN